jgi:hypothetical protein
MIGIFCVTKDDGEIIEDYICYHQRIIGYSNIYIIDNVSTDHRVHIVYQKYIPLGLHVFSEPGPHQQANYMNKYIHMYKHLYEFIVPLDTDEFLYSALEREFGSDPGDPERILEVFRKIPKHLTYFGISECLTTMSAPFTTVYPARELTKFQLTADKNLFIEKRIYRSEAFGYINEGNHTGYVNSIPDTDPTLTRISIGHAHFHNTGNLRKFQRDAKFMKGRGYCDVTNPYNVQYDSLFCMRGKEICFDNHRVLSYSKKITEIQIFDIFLKYKKKIPTKQELLEMVERIHWKGRWADIFNQLTNEIIEGEVPVVDDMTRNSIIFQEESMNDADIVNYSFIQEILKCN